MTFIGFAVVFFLIWFFNSVRIITEYERAVVFRLGRVLDKPKGPGLVFIFWPIDRVVIVSLRLVNHGCPVARYHHQR